MEAVVSITRPVLTPEERETRMQQIEKAAALLFVAMQRQEQERSEKRA